MTHPEGPKLEKLVNTSGFLFQLRVQEEVKATAGKHGWSVVSREHPWVDAKRQPVKEYFLDLILRKGFTHMVVECKRSVDASWVFLTEPEDQTEEPGKIQVRARVYLVSGQVEAWKDFDVRPSTVESEFCVVRGGGEDQISLLERLGRHVVDASEELGKLLSTLASPARTVIVPVIVTNAKLYICAADPARISLDEGKLSGGRFFDVGYIRFRKSLAQRFTKNAQLSTLRQADQDLQRTVFVVHSEHLVPLLTKWDLSEL